MPCICGHLFCHCYVPCPCDESKCACEKCAKSFGHNCRLCGKVLLWYKVTSNHQSEDDGCECFTQSRLTANQNKLNKNPHNIFPFVAIPVLVQRSYTPSEFEATPAVNLHQGLSGYIPNDDANPHIVMNSVSLPPGFGPVTSGVDSHHVLGSHNPNDGSNIHEAANSASCSGFGITPLVDLHQEVTIQNPNNDTNIYEPMNSASCSELGITPIVNLHQEVVSHDPNASSNIHKVGNSTSSAPGWGVLTPGWGVLPPGFGVVTPEVDSHGDASLATNNPELQTNLNFASSVDIYPQPGRPEIDSQQKEASSNSSSGDTNGYLRNLEKTPFSRWDERLNRNAMTQRWLSKDVKRAFNGLKGDPNPKQS